MNPLVTVICTSYNHDAYVEAALQSVVTQDYPNLELIVIDNGSTDHTVDRINFFIKHRAILFINNPINVGLNKAFNQGLKLAGGRYIIDLSADDVLLPGRIAKQVNLFEQLPSSYAVVFTNAAYIDEGGRKTGYHYPIDANGRALVQVPAGDVFQHILNSYFICTPTMMMRRDVLEELGGYDEELTFEDFDFWVRSSRLYQYAYLDEILTQKRQLPNSLSSQVVRTDNRLLSSSLTVCHKALDRCTTPDERKALAGRVRGFIRKAFYAEQFKLALEFGQLLTKLERPNAGTQVILTLSRLQLPVNGLYRQYIRWRQRGHSLRGT